MSIRSSGFESYRPLVILFLIKFSFFQNSLAPAGFFFQHLITNFRFILFKLTNVEDGFSRVPFMSVICLRDDKVVNVVPKCVHAKLEQHFFVKKTKAVVKFWFWHA